MVMCTGINPALLDKPTQDKELNEILKQVKDITKYNFQVIERIYTVRHWLKKNEKKYNYELLVEVGGILPFQIITCAKTLSEIKCYLLGILNNFKIEEK